MPTCVSQNSTDKSERKRMIETLEQYEEIRRTGFTSPAEKELVKTIEALRKVARAADFAVFNNSPFLGQADLQTALDALPDWLKDG